MGDAEQKNTNLRILGRITHDLEVRHAEKTGRLIVNFSLAWNRSKGAEAVYVDFACIDTETSQFIIDNFKKGDMIHVLEASPSNRKMRDGKNRLQFLVWNVLVPYSAGGVSHGVPQEDDVPY